MIQPTATREAWTLQTLAVMQALYFAVTPNFRRVTLGRRDGVWRLSFVLEAESEEDRQLIDEVVRSFDELQAGPEDRVKEVVVTADWLPWPELPDRVVYQRREMEQ